MPKRILIALLLSLLLTASALAQGTSTSLIEYTDGERVEWKDDGNTPPGDILMEFLNSGKDGKMTVTDNGKTEFVIDKVGEQLTLSSPDNPTEKMTIQELIDGLSEKPAPNPPTR